MSMTVVPIEIQFGRNQPQVLCYAEIRFWPLGGLGHKRGDVLSDFERLSSELNRLRLLRVGLSWVEERLRADQSAVFIRVKDDDLVAGAHRFALMVTVLSQEGLNASGPVETMITSIKAVREAPSGCASRRDRMTLLTSSTWCRRWRRSGPKWASPRRREQRIRARL
jgi:hypothetical protein